MWIWNWRHNAGAEEIGEPVIPAYLVKQLIVSICSAWVRYNIEPNISDPFRLFAHIERNGASGPNELVEPAISGNPVKTRHTGREAMQLFQQDWYPFCKIGCGEPRYIGRGAFYDIGKPNPEIRQLSIVFRKQHIYAKLLPDRFAEFGARECRPESVGRTGKVMTSLNRINTGVDS